MTASSTTLDAVLLGPGIHSARPATPPGGTLYVCTTHTMIEKYDGSSWGDWADLAGSGGGGGGASYAEFTISVPSGSADGSVTLGARTVVSDTDSLVASYSAGVFTLTAAGIYAVQAIVAYGGGNSFSAGRHFLGIARDATDGLARTDPLVGVGEDSFSVSCAGAPFATSIGIEYYRGGALAGGAASPTMRVLITKLG